MLPYRPHKARSLCLGAPLWALFGIFGCNATQTDPAAVAGAAASLDASAADGARITAVSGPSGVRSDRLDEGTFLGKGAELDPGQQIETPKGTLAELEIGDGPRVRVNEQTALRLPGGDSADALVLTRGEIVVVADEAPLTVAAGDESLRVESGEAQIRNVGASRHYAVVDGRAVLTAGDETIELGPGESLDAPLATEDEKAPIRPELSLRPLEDTGWSRVFETAALMADTVPRGVGSLTARRPGSNDERQRLEVTDQKVTVNISGRIAHTEIEQAFFNERPAVLEGIYRFPLPADGSISGLSLLVGNTWMQGEMLEKQRARQIFKQIVDATIPRDPALLEWEQGNMFKLRVFPIPGRGERRIRLSYTQILPVVGDTLRYRFPMGGSGATGTEVGHFEMTVNVDRASLGNTDAEDISTPMLAMTRRDLGDRIELRADEDRFLPTYDLGVDIPAPDAALPVSAQTHLDKDGQAYFMVSLRPELELGSSERPVHYAFVLDRSHSTTPELWTVSRGLVEALATAMDPEDRFTVLACDAACDEAPDGLHAPEPAAIDRAKQFLEQQDLAGASDVGNMLIEAAEALDRNGRDAERVIVYLGDGAPSSGELAADKLVRLVDAPLQRARVLAVAMGARSDLTTLGAVVRHTGGDLLRADARDDLDALVRELHLRAEVPVARDLEVDLPPGMVATHRHNVSGLRSTESLILVGKLEHPVSGDIRLRAKGPAGEVEQTFAVDLHASRDGTPSPHRHLPRTWAQMEIAALTRTEGFDARDRIVELSRAYTVLSRHTALLVLENDAMYREFNVVRAAKNKDRWQGELPESEPAEETEDKEAEKSSSSVRTRVEEDATAASERGRFSSGPLGGAVAKDEDGELHDARDRSSASAPSTIPGTGTAPLPDPEPFPGSTPAPQAPLDPGPDLGDVLGTEGDDDVGGDLGLSGTGRGAGGGTKSGGFAPPPPAKKSSKRKRPKADAPLAEQRPTRRGHVGGLWSPRRVVRRLSIATTTGPNTRALDKVEELERRVQADPTSRANHGKLVRAAFLADHPDALAFARDWAEADPDHAGALLALADVLAARGDPLSLRAYDSASEVQPFSRQQHLSLAEGYASKGDLRRSCSHRRALVSIDPSRGEHHAALASCLHHAGRVSDAKLALADGTRRATRDESALVRARAVLDGGRMPQVQLHRGAQLRATLTWAGEDDLDIALVDRRGRRLSAMRPTDIRVREDAGREELTMRRVRNAVVIEVTRVGNPTVQLAGSSATVEPVRAELTIRTSHGKRTIPVTIAAGSVRVARVSWRTRRR